MGLTKEEKEKIFKEVERHPGDTGSPEAQIALFTERISRLSEHFKVHKKDHNSRRGLLILLGQRRRLLNYLKKTNLEKYKQLIEKMGLSK